MTDWLVYHSQKTVGHSYASLGRPVAYSRKPQTKLCFGDRIWIVEGSTDIPTRYTLVDCFRYADTDYPPFLPPWNGFAVRVLGTESLLTAPVPLDMSAEWQAEIRDRFLTKQRFFVSLAAEPQVIEGLEALGSATRVVTRVPTAATADA